MKQSVREFPLVAHPKAVAHDWATRLWCGTCLVAARQATAPFLREYQEAHDAAEAAEAAEAAASREVAAAARAHARAHRLAVGLVDRAAGDPVFADALVAAARSARRAGLSREPLTRNT